MRFIAGPLNKQLLQNLLGEVIESCTRVREPAPEIWTER